MFRRVLLGGLSVADWLQTLRAERLLLGGRLNCVGRHDRGLHDFIQARLQAQVRDRAVVFVPTRAHVRRQRRRRLLPRNWLQVSVYLLLGKRRKDHLARRVSYLHDLFVRFFLGLGERAEGASRAVADSLAIVRIGVAHSVRV